MKARDFHNSNSPILRDPSGATYVAPPQGAGAQVTRPVSHPGALPNASPGSSSSGDPATTPAPAPLDAAELEQYMAAMLAQMRAAATPTYFDRLLGVCANVLESEHAMAVLAHEAAADSERGVSQHHGTAGALAAAVVEFSDDLLRRAATLVEDREAVTQP